MFKIIGISLLSILLIHIIANAQNIVPNSSFEEYVTCPGNYSQDVREFRVKHWRSANTGTPDNFNACSKGEASVPYNWAGVSDAYDGKGYVGIYMWINGKNNYREYLQSTLVEPLLKDSLYSIEFHYKLSSYSKYAIDRIGLILTDSVLTIINDQVYGCSPTVSIVQDSALTKQTGDWETAQQEYRARGGEKHLTIGNFFDNKSTHYYFIKFRPVSQHMLAESSYYYIDDLRITPKFIRPLQIKSFQIFGDTDVSIDTTYILKNIRFDFDQYALQNSSYEELNKVVRWLHLNPSVSILLKGHTDDQGSDQYNAELSLNRAKSTADYLVAHGISSSRIKTSGYGKSNPLIDNDSEEARIVNRRVEIKFLK